MKFRDLLEWETRQECVICDETAYRAYWLEPGGPVPIFLCEKHMYLPVHMVIHPELTVEEVVKLIDSNQ